MDIRKVRKLIDLLESSSVDEIEIHEGEESVRVSRHRAPPAAAGAPLPTRHRPAARRPSPRPHRRGGPHPEPPHRPTPRRTARSRPDTS